ncbi:NAD-dependent epimerase/dehydratase family protein [Lutispora sp.]|uniref:NAD-dependent epimerase/dehydratase family protein n=1 Tax=Lutispora sp. TaxID=2828727 RepID=UPI002B1FA61C|nr:NAD-dependent epimerase/dehydratase family protein [Lutispora sp.]MEA4961770.1 NAD-dependent epimerase/dehydratase family protein [Lutispora sp.]
MCTVLVTGGAGFIGSAVVDLLLSNGHKVVVVDNLSNGNMDNVNKASIFYNMDITDLKLSNIFEIERPQYVIHMAAQINVEKSIKDPISDANINIIGSINILECCRRSGVQKIIYSSTAAVYGNPLYLGIDEKHELNPISFYGISKYITERYIKLFNALCGLNYTILRYSNVYGIRQSISGEGGVIPCFIMHMLKGEKPTIYGNGDQTRDFIYVDDVARANILALEKGDNEIFNIGTGIEVSINDLLKSLSSIIGDCIPLYKREKKGDIRYCYFDIRKSSGILGWEPEYMLKEGLDNTIQWYSKLLA